MHELNNLDVLVRRREDDDPVEVAQLKHELVANVWHQQEAARAVVYKLERKYTSEEDLDKYVQMREEARSFWGGLTGVNDEELSSESPVCYVLPKAELIMDVLECLPGPEYMQQSKEFQCGAGGFYNLDLGLAVVFRGSSWWKTVRTMIHEKGHLDGIGKIMYSRDEEKFVRRRVGFMSDHGNALEEGAVTWGSAQMLARPEFGATYPEWSEKMNVEVGMVQSMSVEEKREKSLDSEEFGVSHYRLAARIVEQILVGLSGYYGSRRVAERVFFGSRVNDEMNKDALWPAMKKVFPVTSGRDMMMELKSISVKDVGRMEQLLENLG